MDDVTEYPKEQEHTDQVKLVRTTTHAGRTFTVRADHRHGQPLQIELAIETAEGIDVGALKGTMDPSDLLAASKALALVIASIAVALDQATPRPTLAQTQQTYPNAYRSWTPEDDARLASQFHSGHSVNDIAAEFGRKPSAIRSRIEKLGLTPADISPPPDLVAEEDMTGDPDQ